MDKSNEKISLKTGVFSISTRLKINKIGNRLGLEKTV